MWKTIIERISIGDAPYGTHIFNNNLIFKQHFISIKESNINMIIDFFKINVGIDPQYIYFDSWKDIKRKVIKDILINNYVYKLTEELKLDIVKSKYLLSMIHLYITLKKITPTDIKLATATTVDNPNVHTYISKLNCIHINPSDSNLLINIDMPTVEDIETSEDDDEYTTTDSYEETQDELIDLEE